MSIRDAGRNLGGYKPSSELALTHMEWIVYNLNSDDFPRARFEFRRLVTVWFESGPNLRKMYQKEGALLHRATHGRTNLLFTETGSGNLLWMPEILDEDIGSQEDHALGHFARLIANPRWDLLAGPCARCDNYYLKKTRRQKMYCSRTCGSAATAISATKKMRQRDQAEKIAVAQTLVHEWTTSARKLDWKQWVSKKTGYNIRWVTQAVNRDQLRPPVEAPAKSDHASVPSVRSKR